jgi:hypothetical protein
MMGRPKSTSLLACTAVVMACGWLAGCGTSQVPDPKSAANDYARAVQSQDADALYGMLTESAQRSRSKEDVRKLLAEDRTELAEQARAVQGKDARVEATARLRYQDGEETALELREGHFWVSAAGTMPGGAKSPEQALDQLRRVLARRSYVGLMRVLSPQTRAAVEADLRSLVIGLDHPETLSVETTGDAAQITVPGGHHVRLRREAGIWRVEDFD